MCDQNEHPVVNFDKNPSGDTRPQFGNRFLTKEEDVFTHNACTLVTAKNLLVVTEFSSKNPIYSSLMLGSFLHKYNCFHYTTCIPNRDNVEWDAEQEAQALAAVQKNSTQRMTPEDQSRFENEADKFWDSFYDIHQNRFFKDRHWLFTEFPELAPKEGCNEPRQIFELGCGVGNTILPILKYSQETNLKVFGCDFSAKAIDIFRENPEFDEKRCNVFVMDATANDWNVPFPQGSLDIIVLIFVLSAISPDKMHVVAENCFKFLKPGGLVLFRDYGRYDLAQLRFKAGKCLQENFYVRGDGTRVYFFEQEELKSLFCDVGFIEDQNIVDRRLQVNRGRMLKMYRVWVQKKFRKPIS